ncbi:F-box/LRR-repeat protein At3g48880-like [Pistacia vera]|uniref:F-box/LRR-repeat protein At3g48880-like n=1 Tax=Pistacia vera TaxID=55513 RepID=UPI001263AB2C|nr:F-box/LRR-repeat protein At3g48880-like [Pistacia vera]
MEEGAPAVRRWEDPAVRKWEDPAIRRWEDLDTDILVKIFLSFDVLQLTLGIANVFNSCELGSNPPYIAIYRCPQLRRLVMPAWNRIKKDVICKAIRTWRCLESLTMPSIADPPYLIEEIALNCKNFSELKVIGPFDVLFASTIAKFLPNLKVLGLRCSMIVKDALMLILDDLPNLEVLNISHCLLLPPSMPEKIIKKLDKIILQKAAPREFLTCTEHSCIMCQRT